MIKLFSREFVQELWGKHAAELSVPQIPFSEKDVLDALREYAIRPEQIRELNPQSEAIIAFNGQRSSESQHDFLVSDKDVTLEEYLTRIDHLAGSDEWAVMYYGLYAASPVLWDVAKEFSDRLAFSIGYRPGGRVDIDCFIGRYSSTHTGIHVDHAHNFGFTLRNGKTMFTWPGNRSDLLEVKWPEYEPFKSEGTSLANRTDRVTYFPQDYLHVAETKTDVSVNVNIAFWETGNDSQPNANYVKKILPAPNRTRHNVRLSGITNLTSDNELLLSTLRALLGNDSLKKRMMVSQLILDTSARLNIGRQIVEIDEIDDVITIKSAHFSGYQCSNWVKYLSQQTVIVPILPIAKIFMISSIIFLTERKWIFHRLGVSSTEAPTMKSLALYQH